MAAMTHGPLDGVVVVALEQAVAVPFATRQLADLGARVIKLERPGSGDFARSYDTKVGGMSSAFVWLNRGKESVEIDIKSDDGRVLLDALLQRADVFIHNISPSAATRAGLDSDTLQRSYPNLIAGSVSGYGSSGPLAESKAYDLLIQGETGLLSLNGDDEHMAKVGISIADISAGMYAYSSLLAAILHRWRTGEALPVDISLFDSLTEWLGYPMYYTMYGGEAPRRTGMSHATIAPYGAFAVGRDDQILIAVQNDHEWIHFCSEVLRQSDLASDPRFLSHELRVAHGDELDELIAMCFEHLDRSTVMDRLGNAGIATARINTIGYLAHHEQLADPRRWTSTGTEVGPVTTVLPPWIPREGLTYGDVPALGQHTAQVRTWLGLPTHGQDPIAQLIDNAREDSD